MAIYHPPKMITNNAAPILSADLAYEVNGKCGCQTIILSGEGTTVWNASDPSDQPDLDGCVDYSNVYKIVALENTKFRGLSANNISQIQMDAALVFGNSGFILKPDANILADFTYINILSGTLMLYRDCSQS
tara:strand:- start:1864 stop:2259 length:396 start_codon:yes stop_codon:yes gene_type:complete